MMRLALFLICSALCLVLRAQVTIPVPSAGYATIQSALNAAQTGDTVEVLPGSYVENLVIASKVITLKAQTRGTVVIDGSGVAPVLSILGSDGVVVDGLELSNGLGRLDPIVNSGISSGGGILIDRYDYVTGVVTASSASIFYCKFDGNAADRGSAVFSETLAYLTLLEGCEITNNIGTLGTAVYCKSGPTVVRHSVIASNPGPGGLQVLGHAELEDTIIRDHPNGIGLAATDGGLKRCVIQDNGVAFIGGTDLSRGGPTPIYLFESCLITGNGLTGYTKSQLHFYANARLSNCTIVDNNSPAGIPMITSSGFALVTIDNSIVRNNGAADYGTEAAPPWNPLIGIWAPAAVLVTNSCMSQPDMSGPNNISADPLFVDALFGDYRLLPGSPCVDSGDMSLSYVATSDLSGHSRVVLNEVDMGCLEARSMAHHPASAGRVGLSVGGPFDLLLINGSNGGVERRVTVPIGSSSVVSVAQPFFNANPVNFVIFGVLAEADAESAITLPFGIGDMTFAPTPLVPAFLHWLFFTYTDNFNPAAGQFTGSSPTPWTSGFGPAIPFPLQLTLQGVIEETPGVFVTTNPQSSELWVRTRAGTPYHGHECLPSASSWLRCPQFLTY